MSKLVYKPEGADPKKWDFDPSRLMSPEAEAIERHTGMTFGQWQAALGQESMLAMHGLLYVMLKRGAPTLKWDEVQFCMADVDIELSDEEAADVVRSLEEKAATESLSGQEQATLDALREQGYSSADAAPKAPEKTSD